MSTATVLSQLQDHLEKTQQFGEKFTKIYPTDAQWETLIDLSSQLTEAAKNFHSEVQRQKELYSDQVWKEVEKHRSTAQSHKSHLLAKGQLKQPTIFQRNIVTIFEDLKVSSLDSKDKKYKKRFTHERCKLVRGLTPDGVISWANAFTPTTWSQLPTDVFMGLLDDIEEPVLVQWPSLIRDTLHKLMEEEGALKISTEYQAFLKGQYRNQKIQHNLILGSVWRSKESTA
jgi:hypothetical protein